MEINFDVATLKLWALELETRSQVVLSDAFAVRPSSTSIVVMPMSRVSQFKEENENFTRSFGNSPGVLLVADNNSCRRCLSPKRKWENAISPINFVPQLQARKHLQHPLDSIWRWSVPLKSNRSFSAIHGTRQRLLLIRNRSAQQKVEMKKLNHHQFRYAMLHLDVFRTACDAEIDVRCSSKISSCCGLSGFDFPIRYRCMWLKCKVSSLAELSSLGDERMLWIDAGKPSTMAFVQKSIVE